MLNFFKRKILKLLYQYTLKVHKTTMFISQASSYSKYYDLCKIKSNLKLKETNLIKLQANNFIKNGFCSFSTKASKNVVVEMLKKIKEEESSGYWLSAEKSNLNNFFIKYLKVF